MCEPWSTFTNAAYIVVAVFILQLDYSACLTLVGCVLALAIASSVFHYDCSRHHTPAHRMDEGAIYAVLGMLIYHVWGHNVTVFAIVVVVVSITFLILSVIDLYHLTPVFAVLITIGIWISDGPLTAAVGAALFGFAGWLRLSKYGEMDLPHGAWHLLTAACILYAWGVTL